jgi:Protein of unknown function (DUF2924)
MAKRRHPDCSCEVFLEPAARLDGARSVNDLVAGLEALNAQGLRLQWRNHLGGVPPAQMSRWLLMNLLAYRIQAAALGGLDKATLSVIHQPRGADLESSCGGPFTTRAASTRDGIALKPGALLTREWRGKLERVAVLDKGFAWNGKTYGSLSQIAKTITGTSWNGHRFFGLRTSKPEGLGSATTRGPDGAALSKSDGATGVRSGFQTNREPPENRAQSSGARRRHLIRGKDRPICAPPVGSDPSNAPSPAAEDAGRPRSSDHCAGARPIERTATNRKGRHRDPAGASP